MVSDPRDLVVPAAIVTLHCGRHNKSVKTDSQGRFAFGTRPASEVCRISANHPGFSPFNESVTGDAGTLSIRLILAPLSQTVTVSAAPDPLFLPALGSLTLSDDELKSISNNTQDLIRYSKLLAGVVGGTDVIYVDGLPTSALPPPETIARITINADPFSAEYADGDLTHIDIITKSPPRNFRFSFGGLDLSAGGRSTLNPSLQSKSGSENGYVSGAIPHLPVAFSLHATFGSNLSDQPIVAVFPETSTFTSARELHSVSAGNHNGSGSLDLDYSATERLRAHFAFSESRTSASNLGAGGVALPEAGLRSSTESHEARATVTEHADRFTYQSGLVVSQANSDTRANTDDLGVTVLGDFVVGGAPTTSSDTLHTMWTWKNVFRSATSSWTAGFSVAGSDDLEREVPNTFGVLQFGNLQAYSDALTGQGTGTWLVTRGNGTVRYASKSAAPFVQKQVVHTPRLLVTAGLRGDYQSRYGMLISPRLSAATQWRGIVLRAGSGLFVRNLPSNVFVKTTENDGSHLEQYMLSDTSLTENLMPLTGSGQLIRSRLASDLTRPREFMVKSSIERPFRKFTPGVEYTWTRDLHLLGSQRLADGGGWSDVLESNRLSEKHRVQTRLGYKWRAETLIVHYEWIRSRDDSSGPFSFPAQQDDLRAEWARSAGVSPHNVSLAGNIKLPRAISLNLIETWRSSAPYNVTTGLDPERDGLYTDRGGLPRNSGSGPAYSSLSVYGHKRVALPGLLTGHRERIYVDLGVQGNNLLNNKNYLSVGSIIGSPTFGQPLAASPGRSVRVWLNLD
jgi:hypothetical protein